MQLNDLERLQKNIEEVKRQKAQLDGQKKELDAQKEDLKSKFDAAGVTIDTLPIVLKQLEQEIAECTVDITNVLAEAHKL